MSQVYQRPPPDAAGPPSAWGHMFKAAPDVQVSCPSCHSQMDLICARDPLSSAALRCKGHQLCLLFWAVMMLFKEGKDLAVVCVMLRLGGASIWSVPVPLDLPWLSIEACVKTLAIPPSWVQKLVTSQAVLSGQQDVSSKPLKMLLVPLAVEMNLLQSVLRSLALGFARALCSSSARAGSHRGNGFHGKCLEQTAYAHRSNIQDPSLTGPSPSVLVVWPWNQRVGRFAEICPQTRDDTDV
ncbi:hypothetical protein AOLI_G00231140 [Acnodon oligacanthus]